MRRRLGAYLLMRILRQMRRGRLEFPSDEEAASFFGMDAAQLEDYLLATYPGKKEDVRQLWRPLWNTGVLQVDHILRDVMNEFAKKHTSATGKEFFRPLVPPLPLQGGNDR